MPRNSTPLCHEERGALGSITENAVLLLIPCLRLLNDRKGKHPAATGKSDFQPGLEPQPVRVLKTGHQPGCAASVWPLGTQAWARSPAVSKEGTGSPAVSKEGRVCLRQDLVKRQPHVVKWMTELGVSGARAPH